MVKPSQPLLIAFLRCLMLYVASAAAMAAELRVAVAANFHATARELVDAYAAISDNQVTLIAGSTGKLYAQIRNRAPFDILLAADSDRPAKLEADGYGLRGSRFTYARGRLVLWSRNSELIDADEGLPRPDNIRHLALANPRLAPYGTAAVQTLENLGVLDLWEGRLVRGENIAQAYQFVASGNAELGFIAAVQAPHATGSLWPVPQALHEPIDQQALQLSDTPAASHFMRWLQSADARTLIEEAGFETLEEDDDADRS